MSNDERINMATKKKATKKIPRKTSGISSKKANVKKTAVKPEAAKATKKKAVQSPRMAQPEEGADSIASAANLGAAVDEGKSSSRTSYEKLVNPQNYHEYMRASKFRGRY